MDLNIVIVFPWHNPHDRDMIDKKNIVQKQFDLLRVEKHRLIECDASCLRQRRAFFLRPVRRGRSPIMHGVRSIGMHAESDNVNLSRRGLSQDFAVGRWQRGILSRFVLNIEIRPEQAEDRRNILI